METRLLVSPADLDMYHRWIASHPQATLWQSLEWKEYQEALGRQTRLYGVLENNKIVASALVVIDRTSLGLSTWDIPRGPLGEKAEGKWEKELMECILKDAKTEGCMCLYYSPLSPFPFPLSQRT